MYVPCQQWVGRGLFAWTLFQRGWMEAWWWWKEKVIGGLTWHVSALHNTSLPQWWYLFTHSKQHIQLELHCPHCHGSCTGKTRLSLVYSDELAMSTCLIAHLEPGLRSLRSVCLPTSHEVNMCADDPEITGLECMNISVDGHTPQFEGGCFLVATPATIQWVVHCLFYAVVTLLKDGDLVSLTTKPNLFSEVREQPSSILVWDSSISKATPPPAISADAQGSNETDEFAQL